MIMVTERELADRLRVHRNTLKNFRKRGLPFHKPGGWIVRYDLDEVDAWLEKQRAKMAARAAGGRR